MLSKLDYGVNVDQLKDTIIWNVEAGLRLSGPEVARAAQLQTALFARMHDFMQRYDFIIAPVSERSSW